MVATNSSTPVSSTGMGESSSHPIAHCDGPERITSPHGRDHDSELGRPKSGPKPKPSVLRFTKSFGARRKLAPLSPTSPPSPIPKEAHELPVRHKHTFTPSSLRHTFEVAIEAPPTSPVCDITGNSKPQPRHHGHSRHSLLLTKFLWSTRHAQHSERSSDAHSSGQPSPASATSPKGFSSHVRRAPLLRCLSSFYSEEKKSDQAPLTAYPRQGDIAALRDPYCSRADRSFAPVPLWTMNKILFVLAVLQPKPRADDVDMFDDSESEVSFNGTESTLVDSDSEWDLSTTCSSRQDASDPEDVPTSYTKDVGSPVSKGNLLSLAARQVNREPDASTVHMANPRWLCRFYRDPRPESITLSLSVSRNRHRRHQSVNLSSTFWPSSWYGLWEVLIELAHRDAATNVGESERTPQGKGSRKAVAVPQPKEFRWLKMLGGAKPGVGSSHSHLKGGLKGRGQPSFGNQQGSLSPSRPAVYEPSHSACG